MYVSPVTLYMFRFLLHHLQEDHSVTFTPRQRNNITTVTRSSQGLHTITYPNTAGYTEHIYCQHTQQIAAVNTY